MLDLRMKGALKALQQEGLKMRSGQSFDLLLAENPSTGYSWQIDTIAPKGLWKMEVE